MAKSAKQRQQEYRARRKEAGLCAYPGCERKPRKYSRCPDHRRDAKEQAADRAIDAARVLDLELEIETLKNHIALYALDPETETILARIARVEALLSSVTPILNTYKAALAEFGIFLTVEGEAELLKYLPR